MLNPGARRRRWSWQIARIAGIELRVHATFVAFVVWIAATHVVLGDGLADTLAGLALVAVLFLIVVLHELGHALTARRFGIATRDITLLPIGGIARLERFPTDPIEELLVAGAGPAVNVLLALFCLALTFLIRTPWSPAALDLVGGPFLTKLFFVNVGLAGFNLLPAFPMDGGRMVRATLSLFRPRLRATQTAAKLGQAMAAAFVLVGVTYGYATLLIIGIFLGFAARAEAKTAALNAALDGMRVEDVMVTELDVLPACATAAFVADLANSSGMSEFPVVDDRGALLGFVTRKSILDTAKGSRHFTPIERLVCPSAAPVSPGDTVHQLLERVQPEDTVVPVVSDGRLVGLIFPERLLELARARTSAPRTRAALRAAH